MIIFVATREHAYTTHALDEDFGAPLPRCRSLAYPDLFVAPELRGGTYVFTDLERLSARELLVAAELWRQLAGRPGFRVLNDPSRVKTRYALLRSLREAGLNRFDAYRADGHPLPARFPVFVRAESAHEPALTGLLPDQAALDQALAALPAHGQPLRDLVVIEFRGEPVAEGLYRRWGGFAIGDRVHLDHIVTEDSWNVKWGKSGAAPEEWYVADDAAIRENRHAEILRSAFRIAGIDYGRADFAIVDGEPQIYEINTNPHLGRLAEHPSPVRMATMRFSHERFAECLHEIDTPEDTASVHLAPEAFSAAARRAHAELRDALTVTVHDLPETRQLEAENERLRRTLDSVLESRSWQLAAPLRLAARGMRRVAGRPCPAPEAPRAAGVCMLRDAVDLVPFLCGHYLRLGLERIEFIDDGSSDGTGELLERLARRDRRILVRRVWSPVMRQEAEVNAAANRAIAAGFGFVLPFDADEFWDLDRRQLRSLLRNPLPRLVTGRWTNFLQLRTAAAGAPLTAMRYRIPQSDDDGRRAVAAYAQPFVAGTQTKVAVLADGPVRFDRGQHALIEGPRRRDPRLYEVFHLPLRRRDELAKRALDHEPRRRPGRGMACESWQSRFHAAAYREGRLEAVWAANSVDADGFVDVYGHRQRAIVDDRLVRTLRRASRYALLRFGLWSR